MNTLAITIEFRGDQQEVEVRYGFFKAWRGARDSFGGVPRAGQQLEPDESATVEIYAVMFSGEDIESELSPTQLERLEEECLERHEVI